jgi:hypothetical protein
VSLHNVRLEAFTASSFTLFTWCVNNVHLDPSRCSICTLRGRDS